MFFFFSYDVAINLSVVCSTTEGPIGSIFSIAKGFQVCHTAKLFLTKPVWIWKSHVLLNVIKWVGCIMQAARTAKCSVTLRVDDCKLVRVTFCGFV